MREQRQGGDAMARRVLFGVDGSQNSLQALENLGRLFRESDVQFHLFHAVPESSLLYPGELSTLSGEVSEWEKVQKRQAQQVLDQTLGLLVEMGYRRSAVQAETILQSVDTAQNILDASESDEFAAIVLARKGRSAVKRFLLGSTTLKVCQHSETHPVWVIGTVALRPPHILAALDHSDQAERIITHLATFLAPLPEARVTLFNVMPAKPPEFWDDGHILDEAERSERETLVAKWASMYEERMEGVFAKAKQAFTGAGMSQGSITTKIQTRMRGIARDIIAEASRGGYNILAFGRRGASAISEFNLGSRAAKVLQSARDCTLIVVN
jgi:nucleotide-binding universal stress UspA family protein